MEGVQETIRPEFIKFLFSGVLLLITWVLGQWIIAKWDKRKKRLDFDIATSAQFQQIYGDGKQINRLYRIYIKSRSNTTPSNPLKLFPDEKRWDILQKAVEVESKMEAIIVKLSTERKLNDSQIKSLGLMRQAFQQLREDIRDNKELTFIGHGPGYKLFNALACDVAHIISKGKHSSRIGSADARSNLTAITRYGSKDLEEESRKVEYQNE